MDETRPSLARYVRPCRGEVCHSKPTRDQRRGVYPFCADSWREIATCQTNGRIPSGCHKKSTNDARPSCRASNRLMGCGGQTCHSTLLPAPAVWRDEPNRLSSHCASSSNPPAGRSPEGVGSAQPHRTRCSIEACGGPPDTAAAAWRRIPGAGRVRAGRGFAPGALHGTIQGVETEGHGGSDTDRLRSGQLGKPVAGGMITREAAGLAVPAHAGVRLGENSRIGFEAGSDVLAAVYNPRHPIFFNVYMHGPPQRPALFRARARGRDTATRYSRGRWR